MRVIQSSFLRTIVKLFVVTFCLVKSFLLYSQELKFDEYKVKANDTLIHILKRHSLRPVFGPNGSLAETLELNPEKKKHNGDLIYIGEIIKLPNFDNWKNTQISKRQKNINDEYSNNDPTHKKQMSPPEDIAADSLQDNQPKEQKKKRSIDKPMVQKPEQGKSVTTIPPPQKVIPVIDAPSPQKAKPVVDAPSPQKVKPVGMAPLPQKSNETQSTFVDKNNSSKVDKKYQNNFIDESTLPQNPKAIPAKENKTAITPEIKEKETSTVQSDSQADSSLSPIITNKDNFSEMPSFEFFKESLKYCITVPACKIGFQEPDLKCCKKPKPLFYANPPDSF
ncbi:LysM peptidoglycan-binding domain-containing protein [Fluviispira vulneris]|uniref:LysM peptidoglycan-binding domain-containing protein n=1 Tax=Fluviispira vulneris TaxID=2763012 RepID=UPI001649719F|nr:LysM domain-containing protein [Fluviispira vulneris]